VTLDQAIDHATAVGMQGDYAGAEALFRQLVTQAPDHPRVYLNLATALHMQDRYDEALAAVRRSIELRPGYAPAHLNAAKMLLRMARPLEAADACRAAIRIDPDDAEAHGALGRALLMAGDFKRGWVEYEWRWRCGSFEQEKPPTTAPRWTGTGKVQGKTILLMHEQGFGDTIQFVRYANVLAERGAVVMVYSPTELADLIRRMPAVAAVNPPNLNACDFHVPMLSLPLACNTTTPKAVPAPIPYLAPFPKLVDAWRERIKREDPNARLRVGLAWAGRSTHREDRFRSLRLEQFAAIANTAGDGVTFYSLQKWDPAGEASRPPAGMRLIDAGPRLGDFSDAAALIANLDLVICVDTAVAHLAGAMGKPVWVLLPFSPDFRWMLGRADTPWYPTMTLLRQTAFADWTAPIAEAAARLASHK
jgi:tetratricopeptide (TPR) repeat protein